MQNQDIQNKFHGKAYEITPMIKQYLSIKEAHKEYLLFYRMGDFYELFFDDAIIAAKELDIVLTSRGKHSGQEIPMCGVPSHASENYLNKLLKNNHSVAICEQLESPEEAKKRGYKAVVRREVIKIITPGTLLEDGLLDHGNNNYLYSIFEASDSIYLAWVDISVGDFNITTVPINALASELSRLVAAEIIVPDNLLLDERIANILKENVQTITQRPASIFHYERCENRLKQFFHLSHISGLGIFHKNEIIAAGALLEYLEHTQKNNLPKLAKPHKVENSDFMMIDATTRKHLEINYSSQNSSRSNTLLSVLNKTVTAGGSRLMKIYLTSPLLNPDVINKRLDYVEYFYKHHEICEQVRSILKNFNDIERALSKIAANRGSPRELAVINQSMRVAIEVAEFLKFSATELSDGINTLISQIGVFSGILDLLQSALAYDAISNQSDGSCFRKGYSMHLDTLYANLDNEMSAIEKLRAEYQRITDVLNLKISKNNIIGYFVEVNPSNASKIKDPMFIHKQSLGSAIRYTTEDLRKLEADLLYCTDKIKNLESELFLDLCSRTLEASEEIILTAQNIARLDVISALSHVAKRNKYVRPIIDNTKTFHIKAGRHPIVESNSTVQFMPNDCNMDENEAILLLTGPNMAGKSTFLRQNALIVIMAQIGSFIPAESAQIGVVDKLFSRIGSGDNISAGQSTFMTEMLEVAYILNNATPNSLMILDEVGRGTSTYDGVAIAWAVLEHIHDVLNSRTLFATHYHELTELESALDRLHCYSMNVREWDNKVIFLHEVIKGKADKSYGIHVAESAGIPDCVTKRATFILNELSSKSHVDL